jgi:hypothetical protein
MNPLPDKNSTRPSEPPPADITVSRIALRWGAGPALAFGFGIYALQPRLFEIALGWGGIRTLLLVAACSGIQFGCALLLPPTVRKILGGLGWFVATAALVFLVFTYY